MADAVQELEQVDAVEAEDSNESTSSTGNAPATRQPEKRINLDELPEFRKWKSESDRRIAQIERTYQQQLAQAQTEARTRRMEGLDDDDRIKVELEEARNAAVYWQQQATAAQVEREKAGVLRQIAQEASDEYEIEIPVSVLEEAESPDQAWKLATKYWKAQMSEKAKQSTEAQKAREEKRAANKVDTGKGVSTATGDDLDRQLAKAFKDGDTPLYMRLLRESKTRK